ncbi:MAG: hypothetical protein K2M90_07135 [Treponemataceae bacterium]|nr:hypothetical protein [Treponemataceae bacterium]
MKMTKRVLLTAAVMAAASFGFMGCAADDDENDMIEKVDSNNYSINYTNGDSTVSRGYKATTLKHQGAVVEFKFTNAKNAGTSEGGVLGFIWELEEKNGARNFCVLGIRQKDGVPSYYVSKFTNVTDITALNFGAPDNGAVENEVVKAFQTLGDGFVDGSTVTVYADIAPCNGGYEIYFYKTEGSAKSHNTGEAIGSKVSVTSSLVTATEQPPQKNLAIYANVYAGKTLTGSWKFVNTYKDAELAEADAE